jgi:hypothetical protein
MPKQRTNPFVHRDPPADVKRRVRQECGFACVLCGDLYQEYDHFAPEFARCTEHRAEGIALLCATCHRDKNAGRVSNEVVAAARLRATERFRDPPWLHQTRGGAVTLRFGTNILSGRTVGFSFGPQLFFRIDTSDDTLEPWMLSGSLFHGRGNIVRFERNEVLSCSGNWDVELTGRDLTFRCRPRGVVLQLRFSATEIAIERLNLEWASGVTMSIGPDGALCMMGLSHSAYRNRANRVVFKNCRVVEQPRGSQLGPHSVARFVNLFGSTVESFEVDRAMLRRPPVWWI